MDGHAGILSVFPETDVLAGKVFSECSIVPSIVLLFFFISPHIDVLSLCQITHVINVLLAIISQMKLLIVKGACSLY